MKVKILTAVLVLIGLLVTAQKGYACPPGNLYPVARLTTRLQYVFVGRVVTFDGSRSYDPDGYIIKYEWDFNGDGIYEYYETSTSYPDGHFDGVTTHTYAGAYNGIVRLRVRDNGGATSTATININASYDNDNGGVGDDLPDAWEVFYFQNITSRGPEDDSDTGGGDGYNNLCEYLHGTNPKDRNSCPTLPMRIYVPSDVAKSDPYIQRAIKASIDNDTIVVSEGTYNENINFDTILPNYYIDRITLTSTYPGNPEVVAKTIINADDPGAVITIGPTKGIYSRIEGFTITGGIADYGSGIYCNGASPRITNCVITNNNSSIDGGGIYCNNGPSTYIQIWDCVITGNSASSKGGGIYCIGGTANISSCKVVNNNASEGGGIYNKDNSPSLWNCTISGNHAGDDGGGMRNNNSSPTLDGCIFIGNTAGDKGGGMHNENGSNSLLSNCIFTGNSSGGIDGGGGMSNDTSNPILTNCTFSGNSATDNKGCGMTNEDNSDPILTNCIFWGNQAGSYAEIYNKESNCNPVFSYCDIKGCGGSGGWVLDFGIDGGGNIDSDPKFVDASDPCGPDGEFGTMDDGLRLQPHNTCIDKGTNTPTGGLPETDIDGKPRMLDSDADGYDVADIGAYECPMVWFVDAAAVGGNGKTWEDAFKTVQDAVSRAIDYDQIWLAEGTYTGAGNNDIDFDGKKITVRSTNPAEWSVVNETIIDCNGTRTNPHRGFYLHNGENIDSVIAGLTVIRGYGNQKYGYYAGGAIFCDGSSPLITNCIIRDNSKNESSVDGGGIACYNRASPEIIKCVISKNVASWGGGISCWNDSSPTIIDCLISDNSAGDIGGISFYDKCDGTVTNCTISRNSASHRTGGIDCEYDSSPKVTNCIIWGNEDVVGDYDEVYVDGDSVPLFSYCDINGCYDGGAWAWDSNWNGGDNIDANPLFLFANRSAGLDGDFGTFDDGLRLKQGSPCVDAAHDAIAALVDILGLERVDVGAASVVYADMGAYESYSNYGSDTDGDGLWDAEEDILGANPGNSDSDNDGLSDGDEFNTYHTNPLSADTDTDGFSDANEICYNDNCMDYNPYDPVTNPTGTDLNVLSNDTDGDSMLDGWEGKNGLDPLDPTDASGASGDSDGDGLSNVGEYNAGTNPNNKDTDGDGMEDDWEHNNNLNPLDANDIYDDPDSDGFENILEFNFGKTDPDPQSGGGSSTPNIILVQPGGSIQAAINSHATEDAIVVKPGIYTEAVTGSDPTFDIDSKIITLQSINPLDSDIVAKTILKGKDPGYHDTIELNTSNSVISGFTITNGYRGIYCYNSKPQISHCVISENINGGIIIRGVPVLENVTIESCTFSNNGGGLYIQSITHSEILYSRDVTVQNCVFRNNNADYVPVGGAYQKNGGGIYIYASYEPSSPYAGYPLNINIKNCIFSNNKAVSGSGSGGGMCIVTDSYAQEPRKVRVENCVFSHNKAISGGGICSNVKSTGNDRCRSLLLLRNCTFNGNTATNGGAIYNDVVDNFQAYNCILWGDNATTNGQEVYNKGTSSSQNTTAVFTRCDVEGGWNNNDAVYNDAYSVTEDGGGNIGDDPLFVYAEDPAGIDGIYYTGDDGLRLQPSSHCVDAAYLVMGPFCSSGYCSASGGGNGYYINRVQMNGKTMNIDNRPTGTGYTTGGYADYASQKADVEVGGTYTVRVTNATNVWGKCAIWVDWNQDLSFNETADEKKVVLITNGSYFVDVSITVPTGAKLGETRMRIFVWNGTIGSTPTSCTHRITDGEVEDYTIIITNGVPGSGPEIEVGDITDVTGNEPFDVPYVDDTGTGDGNPDYRDIGAYEVPTTIWHVKDTQGGSLNGSSWDNAMYLQNALAQARLYGGEIWVATGIHKPDMGTGISPGDRESSFKLIDNIPLYGGFSGVETVHALRKPTQYKTILSGNIDAVGNNDSYHVVKSFRNNTTAIIDGFTIEGGNAAGTGLGSYGGGIYCQFASPTISNCTITGNKADTGGGIALLNEGPFSSSAVIKNCIFINNEADYGSGMANSYESSPLVSNCIFNGNTQAAQGGAIFNCTYSSPEVTNCIFTGNQADRGGGMANVTHSAPTVANCVFVNNEATAASGADGGAVYNEGSCPALINCTFTGNAAAVTGGIYNAELLEGSSVTNCILWANTGTSPEVGGPGRMIFSYCDVKECGGSKNWDNSFGIDGGGNIESNPYFMDASNPTGPDGIYCTDDDGLRLCVFDPRDGDFQTAFEGSCLDSADNTVAPNKDITGRVRMDVPYILNNGSSAEHFTDRGAYESPAVWYVDIDNDSRGQGRSWISAMDNLQDAIAKAAAGDEIWVASGEYIPGSVRSDKFYLDKAIALYGGFAGTEYNRYMRNWNVNKTVLSGEIGDEYDDEDNCYHVLKISCDDVVLDGFTITRGYANDPDNYEPNEIGAGIHIGSSSPRIANCVIQDNFAVKYGGGVYISGGSPTITDSLFLGNEVYTFDGGGMYCKNSSATVTNCIFHGNIAEYNIYCDGGGMYNENASPTVTRCLFSRNRSRSGGGMFNQDSSPTVTNCIFRENRNNGNGGGMANTASGEGISYLVASNCVFIGNWAGGHAGGLYSDWNSSTSSISTVLTNCTFALNVHQGANDYVGGFLHGGDEDTICNVTNCIFWDNKSLDLNGDPHSSPTPPQIYINPSCPSTVRYCDIQPPYTGDSTIIYGDPLFVTKPEFYDKTTQDGDLDTIIVADATKYNLGDIIQYKPSVDNISRIVTDIDFNTNAITFDPPLTVGQPTEELIDVTNWGKYAITEYSEDNDEYYIQGKIAHLTVATTAPAGSPCIDTGLDDGLPKDSVDLDGDGDTVEKIPYDIIGVPRLQGIFDGLTNDVDMGAFESGGLVANPQTELVNEDAEDHDFRLLIEDDPKGGSVTYEIITDPEHGTWSYSETGGDYIKYTPILNSEENDKFYYKAYDGINYGELIQVNITLVRSEDNPVAVDDEAWINPGQSAITIGVKENDDDVDPDKTLDVIDVAYSGTGSVTLNGDDTITYAHTDPKLDVDGFDYTVQDLTALTDTGHVTVRLNHAPTVANDTATTEKHVLVVIDVTANDSDQDEHLFRIVDLVQPAAGAGEVQIYNHPVQGEYLVYKPNPDGPAGDYSFTYKVEDELGLKSMAATVTVTVNDTTTIADYDEDMISDEDEAEFFGTNPYDTDSDNDGVADGNEVMNGSDPANPYSGDYYANPLPYSTCFGTNQGYTVDQTLDRQCGWKVEQGTCEIKFKPNLCYVGTPPAYLGGFVARLDPDSTISKEFEDKVTGNSNSDIIRVKLYPVNGAMVKVLSGNSVIAGAKFVDSGGTKKIYYWSNNVWQDSGTAWSEYNYSALEYEEHNHNYAMMLKFQFSFLSGKYELYWDQTMNNVDDPVQLGGSGHQYDLPAGINAITHVEFQNGSTEFDVRALYINGNEGDNRAITYPCHCAEISESRVAVSGCMVSPDMSMYDLGWVPSEQDSWRTFWQGTMPVNSGTLGYWNAGALPNGLFDLRARRYGDLYYQVTPLYYIAKPYEATYLYIMYTAVMGHLKTTLNYTEEPDISVPWPGQFPFELRRTYNGNRRLHRSIIEGVTLVDAYDDGFFPGWTHNYQIILVEDANYYESGGTVLGDFADYDDNKLAFGYIFVQYEDGSIHSFRHTTGSLGSGITESIYTPSPDDGSGDYIKRITTKGVDIDGDFICKVKYTLYRSDGTKIEFFDVAPDDNFDNPKVRLIVRDPAQGNYKINGEIPDSPHWKYTTYASAKSDRFGNTLHIDGRIYGTKWFVDKITYQQSPTSKIAIRLNMLPAVDVPITGEIRWNYWYAELVQLDENDNLLNTFRTVVYGYHWYQEFVRQGTGSNPDIYSSWPLFFEIFPRGKEAGEDGTLGTTYVDKGYTYVYGWWDTEAAVNEEFYFDDSHMFAIFKENVPDGADLGEVCNSFSAMSVFYMYDGMGRVSARRDWVDSGNYLDTYYSYSSFDPYSGSQYGQWLCTTANTLYKTTYTVQNKKGELMAQFTDTSDGSIPKQILYDYDGSPPFKPKEITEYWYDYDCQSNDFVQVGRKTVNSYWERYLDSFGSGNPTVYVSDVNTQSVYDLGADLGNDSDDSFVAYNEKDLHKYAHYNLDTNSLSYQILNPSGPHEKPVQTKYLYGLRDGTVSGTDSDNKYLIQQKGRIAETGVAVDDFALTEYTYYDVGGLVETKIDPENFRTFYDYDANHYRKWVKVGLVGSEVPIERYCHDAIGQMLLNADTYGLVTRFDYDDFGDVYKVRTYYDPDAFTKSDAVFIPTTYDSSTPRSTTIYTYDKCRRRTFEKTIPQEKAANQVAAKRVEYPTIIDQPRKITSDDGNPATADSFVEYIYDHRGLRIWEYNYEAASGLWWYKDYWYDSLNRLFWTIWWDYEDRTILKLLANGYQGSGKKAYEDIWGLDSQGSMWELQRRTDYKYEILDRLTNTVATYNYDDAGLPEWTITSYAYDDVGNRTSIKDPRGNVTFFDYDNANRQVKEYFAVPFNTDLGTTKGSAVIRKKIQYYDNNLIKDVDAYDYYGGTPPGPGTLLARNEFTYDDRSRLREVTEAIAQTGGVVTNEAVTTYEYKDAKDGYFDDFTVIEDGAAKNYSNVRISDAESKKTYIAYSEKGQVAKTRHPSNQYEQFIYNGDGTLKKKTVFDSSGVEKWMQFTYDKFARLEQITYPDTSTPGTATYACDGFGRMIQFTDNRNSNDQIGGTGDYANKIIYGYDPLNQIIGITNQDGYYTAYSYRGDEQKHGITVTSPAPGNIIYDVEYKYDLAGRLKTVSEPQLQDDRELVADFAYDDNGNRKQLKYYLVGSEGGATTSADYTYNRDNLLTKFVTAGSPTFTFGGTDGPQSDWATIDGLARLKSAIETITKTDNTTIDHAYTYAYDMRSQLTSADITNIIGGDGLWTADYSYHDSGDMDSRTIESDTDSFTYNGHLMATLDSTNLNWDKNGQLTTGAAAETLIWNWDGKLRSATKAGTTINLKYDPAGNRIYKDESGGTVKRKYIVDVAADLPVVLLEINPDSGSVTGTYIYANGQIIAKHNGDYTTSRYFYLHDRLGSVREIIDSAGNVKRFYTYEPFGKTLEDEGALSNPFMFTGQWYDSEIGEYYLRARMYEPYISRFTSRDPVAGKFEEPLTLHKYLYCGNEPVDRLDPLGLDSVALYDGTDENGGSRFSWAALDFDWRFNVSNLEDAVGFLGTLQDLGVEIEDVYFLDHGREVKGEYYQEVGDEILRPSDNNWLGITSKVVENGALHLRGCMVAAENSGKQYIQQLANIGRHKVDAFDDVVKWSYFPYIGPNYYSEGGLWQATPGGKTPEEIWRGKGFWGRHW